MKYSIPVVGVVASAVCGAMIGPQLAAGTSANHHRPHVVIAQSDEMLPSSSIRDWRSFSDHLAVVSVVREHRGVATAEEKANGEGFIPRTLTIQIDSTEWSRSGAKPAPKSFKIDLDGWVFHGEKITPLRSECEPMMSVGKRYVMPIVFIQRHGHVLKSGWSPLATDTILPYGNGVLGNGDPLVTRRTDQSAVRSDVAGQPVSALVENLTSARDYPGSGGTQPVDERYSKVRKTLQSD